MRLGRFVAAWVAIVTPAALAGGSADEGLLAAGAALARGDARAAAAAASRCAAAGEGAAAARCALVLGRARFSLGDLAGAAEALAGAAGLGPLQPVADQLQGEALLLAGRGSEAVAPLRRAAGGAGAAATKAAALLADALAEAGDPRAAAAQAERAAALALQPAAARASLAWTRARALASLALQVAGGVEGDAKQAPAAAREAQQAARSFWRDSPEHPASAEAAALEARLAGVAGGPLPAPSGRERLSRASHLLSAGMPALAASEARAAREQLSGEERAEAALLLARALAADGRRGEAGPPLEEAWTAAAQRIAAPAGLLLARDRSRRARNAEAVALLDQLLRRFPDAPESEDGAYLAARLQLDAGKAADGRKRLLQLAARKKGGPASDARWALAWLSYREKRKDAAERFAACAAAAEDDDGRARGLYWQARAGRPEKAAALFGRAATLDPLGWYGLLARAALGGPQTGPPPFPGARAARAADPAAADAALLAELELPSLLLELGLLPEAAAELERPLQAHRGHPGELLPVLRALERAGRTDRSVPVAQQLLLGRPAPLEFREPGRALHGAEDKTGRALLELAYPAAFPAEVAQAAQRTGLDPWFIEAVARRESVFRPDARSAAGAVGLLQLLPATARRAAAVLGRPPPADGELVEPAVAVDLGAWYLAELVGRFGDPALAAAAYNAGPRAAAPWVRAGAGKPLDEWVEEIPFRETRRYVKVVVGAWSAYRVLAGGAPPRLVAAVPGIESGTEF